MNDIKTEKARHVACIGWLGRFMLLLVGIAVCAIATFGMREAFAAACVVEAVGIAIQCVAFFYRPNDRTEEREHET